MARKVKKKVMSTLYIDPSCLRITTFLSLLQSVLTSILQLVTEHIYENSVHTHPRACVQLLGNQ